MSFLQVPIARQVTTAVVFTRNKVLVIALTRYGAPDEPCPQPTQSRTHFLQLGRESFLEQISGLRRLSIRIVEPIMNRCADSRP